VALGWVEIIIVAGLGCGCVVLPLVAAVIILLVIHQGKKRPAHPPA
jgi:hypothetical protein